MCFKTKTAGKYTKTFYLNKPNYLIIQGDTNTALAGCLAGSIYNRHNFNNKKIVIASTFSDTKRLNRIMSISRARPGRKWKKGI